MDARHYLAIFVKLFAIFLILYLIPTAVSFTEMLMMSSEVHGIGIYTLGITTFGGLLISLVLWKFPLSISRSILAPSMDETVIELSPLNLLTVLILAVGIYFLYYSISDGIYWILFYQNYVIGTVSDVAYAGNFDYTVRMWTTGFEFILSVIVIIRAQSIARKLLVITR